MNRMDPEIWPGQPYPLVATYDGIGTNFTLFSEVAERVELCLFDDISGNEQRLDMPEAHGYVWHCFLRDGAAAIGLEVRCLLGRGTGELCIGLISVRGLAHGLMA